MGESIVFGGQNSLDFCEVRASVIRIPEVSIRIEEAQKIWDRKCGTSFSFQHFLSSDNTAFFNNINLKSLSLAVVQLGLLDRYLRLNKKPQFFIGNTQNDSVLAVASGVITFEELIEKSQACYLQRPMAPLIDASEIILKGRTLPYYQAYILNDQGMGMVCGEADMNLQKVLQRLIDDYKITKIVNIGPGLIEKSHIVHEYEMREVEIVESIDIDPMLGWFWAGLRKLDLPMEQAQ